MAAEGPAPEPQTQALDYYRPLQWQRAKSVEQHRQWNELVDRYHYLGAPGLVGAHLKYLVSGRQGELLGALGWQSAVQGLGCRDRLIGWDAAQRARGLVHVVNGVRFLILPWVRVRHLASVMLSESVRILQRDWLGHYGSEVWLVESFIDPARFSGASYRAANWVPIGWTRGFAKRQGVFVHHGQKKEVYVYVMEKGLRRRVHGDVQQPLLTRSFLLAQREVERKKTFARRERMKERRKQCHIPEDVTFKTKPELAGEILRAVTQSGYFPARWATCDCSFGNNEAFLASLPAPLLYLAEIPCSRRVWPQAAPGHPELEPDGGIVEGFLSVEGLLSWQTVRICEGEKGPIVAGFARIRVYTSAERTPGTERWLFLRNDCSAPRIVVATGGKVSRDKSWGLLRGPRS